MVTVSAIIVKVNFTTLLALPSLILMLLRASDIREYTSRSIARFIFSPYSYVVSTRQTLILGAPGGIIGAVSTLGMGYFADKTVKIHSPSY